MPLRRILIVVVLMTFVSLTLYNSSNTLHMVKKQVAVSSRWGAEHYVTQSGGEGVKTTTSTGTTPTTCDGPTMLLHQDAATPTVNSVCHCIFQRASLLSSQTPITAIWSSIREHIHIAAYKSLKECWNWQGALDVLNDETTFINLTNTMLNLLQSRLPKSIKTRPHPFVMERIMGIIIKRIQDPTKHPPLRIAVFGGSVTEGFNSRANSINISTSNRDPRLCTWSCRLENLLNEILPIVYFGHTNLQILSSKKSANDNKITDDADLKLVQVRNFAVGGSDSSIGAMSLEYNLFGTDMSQMDIVISAYAANDLQSPIGLERDRIFEHMQQFHKTAKAQRPCSDLPLLIQLADVFEESLATATTRGGGGSIRQSLRYSTEMLETTNWAGVYALSYPDVVRDVIYRNKLDTTLIEHGQLHPGLTFHTGIAWMIAYGLLDGSLQACDASILADYDKAEPRMGISYPVLRDDLSPQDVPEIWNNDTISLQQRCLQNQTSGSTCEYLYMANRLGASTAEDVRSAIKQVATNIYGWDGIGYPVKKPRRTWQAMHENATFTIQLTNLTHPINRMLVLVSNMIKLCTITRILILLLFIDKSYVTTIVISTQYIKSYGVEWESVRLDLVVERMVEHNDSTWTQLQKVELTGFHDSHTSINYSLQLDLGSEIEIGGSVQATFTLVSGSKFQINGIGLCHS